MRSLVVALTGIGLLGLTSCADDSDNDDPDSSGSGGEAGAVSGDGGVSGEGGGGAFVPEPSCQSDEDCPEGSSSTCFRFGESGPGACGSPIAPATECASTSAENECCANDECTEGECFTLVEQPVQCSATAGFDVVNRCVADGCATDADCSGGLCAPEGLGPGRTCIEADCRTDADCTAEEGGVCAYFNLGCCEERIGGAPNRSPHIACVYPGSGCQSDADCDGDERCVIHDGRAECSSACP